MESFYIRAVCKGVLKFLLIVDVSFECCGEFQWMCVLLSYHELVVDKVKFYMIDSYLTLFLAERVPLVSKVTSWNNQRYANFIRDSEIVNKRHD